MRDAPWPGVVAVSGGSDSLALMLLLRDWALAHALAPPTVLTIDHGLQSGSKETARTVQSAAKAAGLKARVLTWKGVKPDANLEAAARSARYALLGAWCHTHAVAGLYVGHTRDDQAETFLLRLARGSGLDGLAAISPRTHVPGQDDILLIRPLLGIARDTLRTFLEARGVPWHDDPMNDESRFARVRIRALLPALEAAGLSKTRIADAASHLSRARAALEQATEDFLIRATLRTLGGFALDAAALPSAPREIGLRALALLLIRTSGATYRPRFERLERLFDDLTGPEFRKGRTLHGCRICPAPKALATLGPSTVLIVSENRNQTGGAVLA